MGHFLFVPQYCQTLEVTIAQVERHFLSIKGTLGIHHKRGTFCSEFITTAEGAAIFAKMSFEAYLGFAVYHLKEESHTFLRFWDLVP
jgi:hypothetical protein